MVFFWDLMDEYGRCLDLLDFWGFRDARMVVKAGKDWGFRMNIGRVGAKTHENVSNKSQEDSRKREVLKC